MDKVRISEIAQEMGLTPKEVVVSAQKVGFEVKAANSSVSPEQAENLMEYIMTGTFPGKVETEAKKEPVKKEVSKEIVEDEPKKEDSPKQEKKPEEKKVAKTPKVETKVVPEPPKAKRKIEKINKKPQEILVEEKVEVKKEVAKTPKEEPKAVEPVVEVKKEVAVEEKPVVEVAKEVAPQEVVKEEVKPEIKKPTLAESSLKKRRGLVIVRKKKKEPVQKSSRKINDVAMPDIVPGAKRKRKVKKTAALGKGDNSQRMDIFGGDISSFELLGEEEMVVLHDFTVKDEPKKVEPLKKKNDGQNNRPRNTSFVQNRGISRKGRKRRKPKKEEINEVVTSIEIPEDIRVYEFAEKLNRPISDIIKVLFTLGVMMTKNDFLDKDSIEILAEEFEVEVTTINPLDEFDYEKDYDDDSDNHETRPPIITIMGHVDHGKTSLLDKIRESRVANSEHGGITQHVGAYMVEKDGQKITFIDTPGHAAFSQMRARGADVTDIVIIVVAADDGVMPQTKEAVEHAKAANVPYMIAINKMDKDTANPDMVKAGLAEIGVTPVDWGGDIEFINVSAHTGDGIEELLENIQIQAELLELQASKDAKAKSTVIECSVEKGRGPVATVIMENGSLNIGDSILCGSSYGRVKAILDENKKSIKILLPGEPGVVVGLNQVPVAGDTLISLDSEKEAKELATKKADYLRQKELSKSTKVTIDDLGAKIAEGKMKSLPIILKADVGGSLEALKATLTELRNDEVKVNIISSAVGGITESDIALSEASEDVVILGFNVRPTGTIKEKAKRLGVKISTYNVIYDLIDDVTGLLSGMLSPIEREENLGQAEVRDVFKVPKLGQIAGCIVTDGSINKGAGVRVIRAGVVIFEGEISTLKRFKDDVNEVKKGYECGIGVVGYSDIKAGDFLESFKIVQDKATL